MSYDRPWYRKPPIGTPLNAADDLFGGLMGFYALNEMGGPAVHDAAHNLDLACAGFGSNSPWASSSTGTGIVTSGYGTVGVQATLPAWLQFPYPLSIACAVRISGTPSGGMRIFALQPNNVAAAPFTGVCFYAASATSIGIGYAFGASGQFPAAVTITPGVDYVLGLTVSSSAHTFYINGVPVQAGAGAGAPVPWTTNSQLLLGGGTYTAGNSACKPIYWGGWWNRALSDAEHAAIGRDVNAIWRRLYRNRVEAALATATPGIFSVAPLSVYANNTTPVVVTGFGTAWTPGSTTQFRLVSPPFGTSISSQSVTDATHATVTIAAGSAAGSCRLDDNSGHTYPMAVAATSFTVSPSTIPANHGGNITLTLTGQGTNWTSGTTFTLPSISGLSLVSKTWHSATSVTLVVTTSSGTGTGNITDSTDADTAALTVATPSLSLASTAVTATSTSTLTLTGTNTAWTLENPSTLFSPSGVTGATISGVTVQSDTHATATLALSGTSGGTLTVTDNSTRSSATVAVHAVPSGSLHFAGPLVLQHTGGSVGTFGGQSNAWLAFRFKANSNAGLNLSTGTLVLDFATKPTNAYTVTYYPATETLRFQFCGTLGTSQSLLATVPIQVGIDYHFLLAWSNGSQTLYVNGQPHTTASIAAGTYAYAGLQVGGFADNAYGTSTPQAMDHTISDVAMGNSYVPSPPEALLLAGGGLSPIQLGVTALAWWPLGGGTVGTNPVNADLTNPWGWLADYTGNGNALSIATTTPAGSLSNATYAAAIPMGSPILISAIIDKTGKFAVFGAFGAATVNGIYPPATISALNATPTVRRNGAAVQLDNPSWFPQTGDSPFVMYPLRCGGVQALAIADGGEGHVSPTATIDNTGTGGSGLTLGSPVLATGVTSYALTNVGGAGYKKPPVLTITDPGGSGTGALGYCVIDGTGRCVGVRITTGGAGYSNPTGTISGGDANAQGVLGSGARVQLSQVGGAVQDNALMLAVGSGYQSPPAVTVASPPNTAGPAGNKAAQARANVYGADAANWGGTPGAIREVVPLVGGKLGCGQGYPAGSPPAVTIGAAPAGGTTATATAVVSAYISDWPVTDPGENYNKPPAITVSDAGTPSRTAALRPMMSGAYAGTFSGTVSLGSAAVTGLSGTGRFQVGQSVSGTGIPAGATIQAINSGTSITLSAVATASGTPSLQVADTFTYDAPASWLTATLGGTGIVYAAWTQGQSVGGLQAVTGGAITNQAGQVETAVGGLLGFADTPTMLAGANAGAVPLGVFDTNLINFAAKNKLHAYRPQVLHGTGSLVLAADETPRSWSSPTGPSSTGGTVIGWELYTSSLGNGVDSMGDPAPYGAWTLCYDDPQVGTADATAVAMSSANDAGKLVITPVMLSGPASPVVIPAGNITLSGGAVTAISLSGLSLGAGWQGAAVRIGTGTGGASASVVVTGGVPAQVNVVAGGGGYAAGTTALLYGTLVSGTTVTLQHDYEYVATTTAGTGPTEWTSSLTVEFAQRSGLWNVGNPWLVAPDARTRGGTALPLDRSNPYAVDDAVLAMLTTPTGRTLGALRTMDSIGTYGGITNYINPQDIPDTSGLNWYACRQVTADFGFARVFNTDPSKGSSGDGTYNWPASTKIYAPQAWAVQGPDAPFAITGTLTAGSTLVTNVSNIGLMVASAISGTGIPAGTTVAAVSRAVTANAVAGSPVLVVHGGTSTLAPGMTVACLGHDTGTRIIPAGTTILSVDSASQVTLSANALAGGYLRLTITSTAAGAGLASQFTLSAPATASGTQALTVTSPGYISLPASDMGQFAGHSVQDGVVELRSAVPHGLSSGIMPNIFGTGPLVFTAGSWTPNVLPDTGHPLAIWVTGPYTIAVGVTTTTNGPTSPQLYGSPTEVAGTWTVMYSSPPGPNCTSYEWEADRCRQLGCGLWLNIPQGYTVPLIQSIVGRIAPHIGRTVPVHLELGNEFFTFSSMRIYFLDVQCLVAYLPAGTSVLGGTPAMIPNGYYAFNLAAGHAMDAFEAAWTAAGLDASRIHRHVSGQFGNPAFALLGLQVAQRAGRRVDHVHGAPYVFLPTDAPVLQAVAPAGSAYAAAGSLPADAINALLNYHTNYSQNFWKEWAAEAAQLQAFGQPIEPLAQPTTSAGGSSLAAGSYYIYYTFVDASGGYGVGNETTVGISQVGPVTVAAGATVNLKMPFWPPWAQALNWYVGVNTAPGVCTFYQQVTRSQYETTYPAGSTFPFTAAIPAGPQPPPSTNQAASHTPVIPTMTCYEGALQNPLSSLTPAYLDLLHDTFMHPSAADAFRGFQVFQQRGNPMVPGSGVYLACYFELTNPTQYPNMWFIAKGTSQMPGDGLGHAYAGTQTYTVSPNRFATIQGGYSADGFAPDGHDHMQYGVSPMLQALRDWSDVASPMPVRPSARQVVRTRRWFAGLSRSGARAGR